MFRSFVFLTFSVLLTIFMPATTVADVLVLSEEKKEKKKQEKRDRYPFPDPPKKEDKKPADTRRDRVCSEYAEAVPQSDCSCVPPGILKCVTTLDGFGCGSQRHPSTRQWADMFMASLRARVALHGTSSVITLYTVGHADGVINNDKSSGSQLKLICSGFGLPDSLIEADEMLAAASSCIAPRIPHKPGGGARAGFGNLRWSTNRITDIDDGHESGPEYRKIEGVFEIAGACQ